MSSWRRRSSSTETASRSASSSRRRPAAVQRGELLAGPVDVALPAAQRARRPVLAAELVEHGAVDAGPGELLERGALLRVVAVDRGDQGLEAAGDEVLDLAAGRQLADLLEDDVLDERGVGHDQAVAGLDVAGLLVRRARGRGPPRARSSCVDVAVAVFMGAGVAPGGWCDSGGRCGYRPGVQTPTSPFRGNRLPFQSRRPRPAPPRRRATAPPAPPARAPAPPSAAASCGSSRTGTPASCAAGEDPLGDVARARSRRPSARRCPRSAAR